jgi:hypothetical protein
MPAKIGGVSLTAATPANIHTAGASGGTYNVNMYNGAATAAVVRLGVSSTTATFEAALELFDNLTLQPDETRSFSGIVCDGTDVYIVGESDTTGVVMVAMGYDE